MLRRLIRLKPPTSRQDNETLRDQAILLFYLSFLFAATGSGNVLFIVLNFRPMERPILPLMGAAILAIYGFILHAALRWRRSSRSYDYLRRACWLYAMLGIAWGALINALSYYGTLDRHALIIGLALGVISTPIICVPAIVAFSFFLPVAVLSVLAITVLGMVDSITGVAFASYTLYAVVGIICTNAAFDGRSRAQAALRREVATVNIFLREYQQGSSDWLWETDALGRMRVVPAHLKSIVRQSGTRPVDQRLDTIFRARLDVAAHPELQRQLQEGRAFRDLTATARSDGRQRWFSLTGHPVYGDDGNIVGFRGIGRDITERYEADLKLAYLARHDGLTGLLNRKAFVAEIEAACAQARKFVLVTIDLDDFKTMNDTYGHHLGDELLVTVAARIGEVLRTGDAAGRLGGDEFAILLMDLDLDAGYGVAQKLAERVAERMALNGRNLKTSATFGVAAPESDTPDASRLFFMADLALYKAKEDGKAKARRFTRELEDEYHARLLQEADLAEAIENGDITVVYQPIADLFTGQVLCLEALARWTHPERGAVSPASFVPVAEASGLIDPLGELILRTACARATQWPDRLQVNINLSPQQLASGRFPTVLADILEETGLAPARVGIEITENIFVDFSRSALEQLAAIKALGVRLVLDDFGTGYSSLSYLRTISVDGLKIDASFLRQLPDRKVEAIIRTVTRLTADLNVHLVAEGVENAMQLQWLRQNGIHFGQGFLLGRPREDPPLDQIDILP
ncbi:putative bifunctional diguanylate cyclase/phosphodiesterase [Aureimonas frigidaquae]|uniref:putative bifunctional diguanylate cyclase/phosphodiesterase n=1 Tax=Aureimonas frigidaquae TaxID=424757 RepID=UPI000781CD1C|nr:EAL domain-containing protein [Aureimonas frigidaquae]